MGNAFVTELRTFFTTLQEEREDLAAREPEDILDCRRKFDELFSSPSFIDSESPAKNPAQSKAVSGVSPDEADSIAPTDSPQTGGTPPKNDLQEECDLALNEQNMFVLLGELLGLADYLEGNASDDDASPDGAPKQAEGAG